MRTRQLPPNPWQVRTRLTQPFVKADIESIQERWKEKYPLMDFKTANLRFDSLVNFCHTYTNEMEFLNLDPK